MSGSVDHREFRNALGRFATGITVITTLGPDGKPEGMTANSFGALSLDPPLIHWCIGKSAPTHDIFHGSETFAINILRAGQRHLSNQFAKSTEDKFVGVNWRAGEGGAPLLDNALASFECRNEAQHDAGDHTILVGLVEKFAYADGEPLLFSGGKYAVAAVYPDDHDTPLNAEAFADLLL